MLTDIVLISLVLTVLISSLAAAVYKLSRPRYISVLDVDLILRPVESSEIAERFDPGLEEVLRATFCRRKFRESQLRSLCELREFFLRMLHNARVFDTLARTTIWMETKSKPGMEDWQGFLESATELHAAATEFRVYALLTLVRIHCWLVFRSRPWSPFPAPRLADLNRVAGRGFSISYRRLKEAVGALYLHYDEELRSQIMARI